MLNAIVRPTQLSVHRGGAEHDQQQTASGASMTRSSKPTDVRRRRSAGRRNDRGRLAQNVIIPLEIC
jgi:hypothetical protein